MNIPLLPNFSVTFLLHIILSMVSFFCYQRVNTSYKEKNISSLKYFANFFLMFGIFLFTIGLPMLVPVSLSPMQLGAFYIFGHVFLYGAMVYFIQVPFSMSFPDYKKWAVRFNILFGTAITFVNIIYWNKPTTEGLITLLNVVGPVGPMIGVLVVLNWIFFGTFYFGNMAYRSRGTNRLKFSLLSIGFLLITIGGPLHDNAASLTQYMIADGLMTVALLLIFAGIYVKKILKPEKAHKEATKS